MTCSWNTSLAAQGALAHRLQHCPKPIHINTNSCAHSSLAPPGGVMARETIEEITTLLDDTFINLLVVEVNNLMIKALKTYLSTK